MQPTHPVALWMVSLAVLVSACREAPPQPAAGTAAAPSALSSAASAEARSPVLTEVGDHAQVCMITDRYMGSAQIPVTVGPRTYFGCCAACKDKLEKNAAARTAIDPVSGASVDKALAVIGREESGHIFYFENRETFLAYRPSN